MKEISTMLILLIAYLVLMSVITFANKTKPGIILYNNLQQKNLSPLIYLHLASVIIMLIPTLIVKQLPVFILEFPDKISIPQIVAFLLCFAAFGFFPWQKFSNVKTDILPSLPYPIILYAGSRIIFLIIYEWFFRGLLLLSCCEWLGTANGIIINVFLYTMIHAIKRSRQEIIGCIPLGIVLCVFTIWWQSIWPAIIFHVQIVAISEWPQLKQFLSPKKQTAL
jgi:hypothetical protein